MSASNPTRGASSIEVVVSELEKIARVMRMVQDDCEAEAMSIDGKPFTAGVVAEQFGNFWPKSRPLLVLWNCSPQLLTKSEGRTHERAAAGERDTTRAILGLAGAMSAAADQARAMTDAELGELLLTGRWTTIEIHEAGRRLTRAAQSQETSHSSSEASS